MSADLHWAWTSLVLSFWLKPCFVFFFYPDFFFILLILFSFVSHAALHGSWLHTPTHPSLLTRLFHHSPHPRPPPPSIATPTPIPHHHPPPLPRLLSRQPCQIDEEHGRCSPHAKQTPPIWPPTWQRTGTGAQCRYTPLTWSANTRLPNLYGARSVS